jgi:hypothetical protein
VRKSPEHVSSLPVTAAFKAIEFPKINFPCNTMSLLWCAVLKEEFYVILFSPVEVHRCFQGMYFSKISVNLQEYMMSHPRKLYSSWSPPWEPQIQQLLIWVGFILFHIYHMKVVEMKPTCCFVRKYGLSQTLMCMTYWQLTTNLLERMGTLWRG